LSRRSGRDVFLNGLKGPAVRYSIVALGAALALAVLLLSLMAVEAETYVVVYDQEDNVVTSEVELIGARSYNETHAVVEDPSFVAIIYKGVKLYHLEDLEDNSTYEVKVALSRLILEVPRGLYYKVTHLSTGLVFEGISEGKLVDCGLLPCGLIEVYVKGSQELRELVEWQGGLIEIKEGVGIESATFFLLLSSLIPTMVALTLSAYYVHARRKFLASVRIPNLLSLNPKLNPHVNSPNSLPESITKTVVRPPDVKVMKREEDKVMKILKVASKAPMSIADLIERDAEWLEKELKKVVKSSHRINIRPTLACLRKKVGLRVKEKIKKLYSILTNLTYKVMCDKISIVIMYEYRPRTKKNKPHKRMKELSPSLRSVTSALRSLRVLKARKNWHDSNNVSD